MIGPAAVPRQCRLLHQRAQARGADFLAGLHEDLGVEAEAAAFGDDGAGDDEIEALALKGAR